MNVWITDEPYPTSPEVLAEANAAGAEQVLHGVPASLASLIPEGTLGLFAVPDPVIEEPRQDPLDHAGALAALLACLNVIPVDHAANAVGVTPAALEAEVLAWEAAAATP